MKVINQSMVTLAVVSGVTFLGNAVAGDMQSFTSVEGSALNPVPVIQHGNFPGMGGGALFDFDNDGDLDIFVANGEGLPNYLYENDGDGHFTDVASALGIQYTDSNCTSAAVGDFDNDGNIDLLIGRQNATHAASTPIYLMNMGNIHGLVQFIDISEQAGFTKLPENVRAMGFAVADYDADGLLDIYIASYDLGFSMDVMQPTAHDDPNVLLKNMGKSNGVVHFSDVTKTAGVAGSLSYGRTPDTQHISWRNHTFVTYASDVNHDGLMDIFALNEAPGYVDLFINKGDMTFELSSQAALTQHGGWMGVASADIDADGYLDYFMTNLGSEMANIPVPAGINVSAPSEPGGTIHHLLLKGSASGTLQNVAAATNVEPSTVLPPLALATFSGINAYEFGWGTTFVDTDNRGWDDLYWVGAHYPGMPFNGVGRFFYNDTDGGFIDQTFERGLFNIPAANPIAYGQSYNGYSVMHGDVNRDGNIDLVIINGGDSPAPLAAGGVRVLLNPGVSDNRSLTINLKGKDSNRYGVGALVEVVTSGDDDDNDTMSQVKEMVTTTGSFSAVQPELHFGIGDDVESVTVKVTWPAGRTTTRVLRGLDENRTIMISESDYHNKDRRRKMRSHH